jgi:hypothetical protein
MSSQKRTDYLTSKIPVARREELEKKYRAKFDKNARYLGRGVYDWQGLQSRDTGVLFLKGVLTFEGIKFKEDSED